MKSEVFALENATWPALLVDEASTICRANQAAVKLFGATLAGASPLLAAIWSSDNHGSAEQFLNHWERSPSATVSLKFNTKGGNPAVYQTSICSFTRETQRYFVLQLFADTAAVADARSTGGQFSLAHKQKLDCALQLARTVSLDFNNALTTILGHTSLVLTKMEPDHEWRKSLLEVEKSAGRAAEIANDLGAFSQQDKEIRAQASGNLNLLLQRTVDGCKANAAFDSITWTLHLDRKLFTARFDEAKMQQAFMKVFENSAEALSRGGLITVQTRNFELSESAQDRSVHLAPGAYVCVEINDNGCGIEPEILPRIFEPFFSTKQSEEHRGLGLAWVYGVVTNHGGGVAVSSQPAAGTSVRIYLPAEKKIVKENGGTTIADLRGDETILFVDDEDLLLTMGQTVLSTYGYRVHTANSGQKALQILAQADPPIDLVITDLVMPSMSGRELIEHIQRVSPGTRILCTTGYVWPNSQPKDPAYLQKPFTSQDLLLRVKESLTEELQPLI
jgi:signal transduction histidine kinase